MPIIKKTKTGFNIQHSTKEVWGVDDPDDDPQPATKPFDLVSQITLYEDGQLDEESVIELFQHLVDTGLAWSLQGSYGRMAEQLIHEGKVERR